MSLLKSRILRFTEYTVNVSLVIFAVACVVILGRSFILRVSAPKEIEVGSKLSIPGTSWKSAQKTVALFLQSDCQGMQKNEDFYRELAEKTSQDPRLHLVVLSSVNDVRIKESLIDNGLGNLEVIQTNFKNLGIASTPILVIVDPDGIVQNVWKGTPSLTEEYDVARALGVHIYDWTIEQAQIENIRSQNKEVTILDIRDRESFAKGHITRAKNIPIDELPFRAVDELSPKGTVVIYGPGGQSMNARQILANDGYKTVFVLRQ